MELESNVVIRFCRHERSQNIVFEIYNRRIKSIICSIIPSLQFADLCESSAVNVKSQFQRGRVGAMPHESIHVSNWYIFYSTSLNSKASILSYEYKFLIIITRSLYNSMPTSKWAGIYKIRRLLRDVMSPVLYHEYPSSGYRSSIFERHSLHHHSSVFLRVERDRERDKDVHISQFYDRLKEWMQYAVIDIGNATASLRAIQFV